MPQIDFYVSPDHRAEARERLACRLVEKAYKNGLKVHLQTESPAQSRRMDELLWTFRDGAFVPHALLPASGTDPVPVTIGHTEPPTGEDAVLVNLAPQPPAAAARFTRILEPVAGEEEERQAARRRFRHYRDEGYTPESHEVKG